MRKPLILATLVLMLAVVACGVPAVVQPTPDQAERETSVAGTVNALLTAAAVASPTPPEVIATFTEALPVPATATLTNTPLPSATPDHPLVVKDALCWEGPGTQYEVVSAVKTGTRVELLGRGSIGAWWIIDNPIYHDPCWVNADVLQFDNGYNLSGLAVFTPRPTPTPTPTSTRTPTPTWTIAP